MLDQDLPLEQADSDLPAVSDQEIRKLLSQAEEKGADLAKIAGGIVDHILTCHFGFPGDFFLFEREREKLINKLTILLEKFPDHSLKNKVIVDLGCGYIGGRDKKPGKNGVTREETEDPAEMDCRNHPWFCRILQMTGAKPIGIDIGNLDGEKFRHLRLDLLDDNALKSIPRESVDAVTTDSMYHSAQLLEMKIQNRALPIKELRRKLFPQIQRILKADGFYMEEDAVEYNKYQTVGKYDLYHEDQSKRDVARLLAAHIKSQPYISHDIAGKISKLMLPYLLAEYNFEPSEEIADIIEFHCAAALDLLAQNLPQRDLTNQFLIELDPRDLAESGDRRQEPWTSRFLSMLGNEPLLIGFNKESNATEQRDLSDQESSTPVELAEKCTNAIIIPELKGLPSKHHNFYLDRICSLLKSDGFYLEQGEHRVSAIKRDQIIIL